MAENYVIARLGEEVTLKELKDRIAKAFEHHGQKLHPLTQSEFAASAQTMLKSGELPGGSIIIQEGGSMTIGPCVN